MATYRCPIAALQGQSGLWNVSAFGKASLGDEATARRYVGDVSR